MNHWISYTIQLHKINKYTNNSHWCINRGSFGIITNFHMLLLNRQLSLIIKKSYFNKYFNCEIYWFHIETKRLSFQSSLQVFKRYISDMTIFCQFCFFCHSVVSNCLTNLALPNLYFYTIRSIAMFVKVLNKVNFRVLTQT